MKYEEWAIVFSLYEGDLYGMILSTQYVVFVETERKCSSISLTDLPVY